MLDRSILILGIIGAWVVSGTGYIVLKKRMGNRLPNGSIVTEIQDDTEDQNPPGTRWSRIGVSFAMSTNILILFFAVFLNIIDLWGQVAPFIALELPTLINWIGLIGIWFYCFWGAATMLYNAKYTPLWEPMRKVVGSELWKRIDEVLYYVWDPIGVSDEPCARGEYESYVLKVLQLVEENNDIHPISVHLANIARNELGLSPDKKRCDCTAGILLKYKEAIKMHLR